MRGELQLLTRAGRRQIDPVDHLSELARQPDLNRHAWVALESRCSCSCRATATPVRVDDGTRTSVGRRQAKAKRVPIRDGKNLTRSATASVLLERYRLPFGLRLSTIPVRPCGGRVQRRLPHQLNSRLAPQLFTEDDRVRNLLLRLAPLPALALNRQVGLLLGDSEIALQDAFRALDHLPRLEPLGQL